MEEVIACVPVAHEEGGWARLSVGNLKVRLGVPVQVNMRAGRLPPKDESGKTFLKVPVNEL